jgi:hypothetical protein
MRIGLVLPLALATLFLIAGMTGVWLQRQALNTDRWVATSGRMLKEREIRRALSGYVADRLGEHRVGSRSGLGELLSKRFPGVDGSGAARPLVRRAVAEALGSGPALVAWEHANRAAHSLVVRVVEGDLAPGGKVTLDLDPLTSQIAEHSVVRRVLGDGRPPNNTRILVARVDEIERAQDVVLGLRTLTWLLLAASLVLIVLAVRLHPDRRRGVIAAAACLVLAGIGVLALREVMGNLVVGHLARTRDAEAAGHAAWSIATSLLVQLAVVAMALGALLAAGAWLAARGSRPSRA